MVGGGIVMTIKTYNIVIKQVGARYLPLYCKTRVANSQWLKFIYPSDIKIPKRWSDELVITREIKSFIAGNNHETAMEPYEAPLKKVRSK